MPPRPLHPTHKLLLDFAPLGVFFIGYRLGGVMAATAALIATTALSLIVIYAIERKLALAPLITGCIVTIFGGLTLLLQDERFIKMKPTIINLLFSIILLADVYLLKKGLLRYVLGISLTLTAQGWRLLSLRWGIFFACLAVLNELIWRHFPTDFWVNFKVFGMFSLTIAFALAQLRLFEKYKA